MGSDISEGTEAAGEGISDKGNSLSKGKEVGKFKGGGQQGTGSGLCPEQSQVERRGSWSPGGGKVLHEAGS